MDDLSTYTRDIIVGHIVLMFHCTHNPVVSYNYFGDGMLPKSNYYMFNNLVYSDVERQGKVNKEEELSWVGFEQNPEGSVTTSVIVGETGIGKLSSHCLDSELGQYKSHSHARHLVGLAVSDAIHVVCACVIIYVCSRRKHLLCTAPICNICEGHPHILPFHSLHLPHNIPPPPCKHYHCHYSAR